MEKITDLKVHGIAEWEAFFDDRQDMRLEEISLHRHSVVGAKGTVIIDAKEAAVKWLWDGRCWWGNVRLSNYDVKIK